MNPVVRFLAVLIFVAVAGCYEPPPIPPDKPLPCTPSATPAKDCPMAYACVMNVCAARICVTAADCPRGLVCGRSGCGVAGTDGAVPPRSGDGGADDAGAGFVGAPTDAGRND